jgi:hypothetical protein
MLPNSKGDRVMPKLVTCFLWAMVASLVAPQMVFAQACSEKFLKDVRIPNPDNSIPGDKSVYVNIGGVWQPYSSPPQSSVASNVLSVVVVVRPWSGDRSGILVLKSNRPAVDTDTDSTKTRVRLVRVGVRPDPSCRTSVYYEEFGDFNRWVSTTAYAAYHNSRARDPEALRRSEDPEHPDEAAETVIRRFHVLYRSSAQRGCVRTDDNSADVMFIDPNSNRAQFSYNRDVVQNGIPLWYSARAWSSVPSGFEGAAVHVTLMKSYQTSNGLACVPFSIPLVGNGEYLLRINDLEGRQKPPSNGREVERYWPETR